MLNYLSYCPTCWCRWASSASKAAVDGCWKLKSRSSIFTAVGRVVIRCSKELSDWEMGIIAGSVGWYVWRLVCWLISGCYCCVGAGKVSTLGEASISVSLMWSVAWRAAICLVYPIGSSSGHAW